uniref:Uncharacterized protein n=1 Tax=Anguilla anguilla TaxID=7936 RepID=A0A0E9PUW3_ANGAN
MLALISLQSCISYVRFTASNNLMQLGQVFMSLDAFLSSSFSISVPFLRGLFWHCGVGANSRHVGEDGTCCQSTHLAQELVLIKAFLIIYARGFDTSGARLF